jgi:ribosomal protein S18 acetylase RimI-like enzyme
MAQAFFDDPLIVYLWPDRAERQRVAPRFYATVTRLGIEAGQAYGVGEPLTGFAAWGWPGQERAGITPLLKSGALGLVFSPLLPVFARAIGIFSKFDELRKRYAPAQYYYLETIGVAPAAQGQGLASKLIRPFLDQADARDLATYTETMTPSNVGLYERYGFNVMAQYDFAGKGLSVWSFLRSPRPRSAPHAPTT